MNTAPVFAYVDAAITVDTGAANQRLVRNFDATDADGDRLEWRIEGAGSLLISRETGATSFCLPFGTGGASIDGDETFEVDVPVSDGTAEIRQSVAITPPGATATDPVFTNLPATDAPTPFGLGGEPAHGPEHRRHRPGGRGADLLDPGRRGCGALRHLRHDRLALHPLGALRGAGGGCRQRRGLR